MMPLFKRLRRYGAVPLTVWTAFLFVSVAMAMAQQPIKFEGTVEADLTESYMWKFSVRIDNQLEGPVPCQNPIDVVMLRNTSCYGSVDPALTVGDRVMVYGFYQRGFGGPVCQVNLCNDAAYFIRPVACCSSAIGLNGEAFYPGDQITIQLIFYAAVFEGGSWCDPDPGSFTVLLWSLPDGQAETVTDFERISEGFYEATVTAGDPGNYRISVTKPGCEAREREFPVHNPGEVFDCMEIDTAGTYTLQQNIDNSAEDCCIRITASEVTFDGNGYYIDGVEGADTTGVCVGSPGADPLEHVTVKDISRVSDWDTGMRFENLTQGEGETESIIEDNGVWWNEYGIQLNGCSHVRVSNNRASSNGEYGILLTGSGHCTITGNTTEGNMDGIFLINSEDNLIENNTSQANYSGIGLSGSSLNTITKNIVSGGYYGIDLYQQSNGNTITGNTIQHNHHNGLHFDHLSTGNSASGNLVCYNNRLDAGHHDVYDGDSNAGDHNICDTTEGWQDTGNSEGCRFPCHDRDGDGIDNDQDNCPDNNNPGQEDMDQDGQGDLCDPDRDGDGVPNDEDGCPDDRDKTEPGACGCGTADTDSDGDQIFDCDDICPHDPENDEDGDGICGDVDECPKDPNNDEDGDEICGDVDKCPKDPNNDEDNDGICGDVDPCPKDQNNDEDGDGICGDIDTCPKDPYNDEDQDGICGDVDTCPEDPKDDEDGDGICGDVDNCPTTANPNQEDYDGNGVGDACQIDVIHMGKIKIWGKRVSGTISGNTCQGDCTLGGGVQIGTVAGNTPLLNVDSDLEIDTSRKTISSKGSANVVAFQMKRNPKKDPEDIPLWYGTLSIDPGKAQVAVGSGAQSKLSLIGALLFNWCLTCPTKGSVILGDDNTITLKGSTLQSAPLKLFVSLPDIVLDPTGNKTTGKLVLLPADFGITEIGIRNNLKLSDFRLELDVVRASITLGGAIKVGKRIKLPRLPVLNIDTIGAAIDLLLDPLYPDGLDVWATLRGPNPAHPSVLSFPQAPPAQFGVAPTKLTVGVHNLSGGLQNVKIIGSLDGALVDQSLTEQYLKAGLNKWLVSGNLTITIDLSGSVELRGQATLLECMDLAQARILVGNPSEISGGINLLGALIGSMALSLTAGTDAKTQDKSVTLSGSSSLTIQVPNYFPVFGGRQFDHRQVTALILITQPAGTSFPSVSKAEFTATIKILFAEGSVKATLMPRPSLAITDPKASPAEGLTSGSYGTGPRLTLTGYETISCRTGQIPGSGSTKSASMTHPIQVPAEEAVILIRVVSDTGTPRFDLTYPDGTIYHPEDAPPVPESPLADTLFFVANEAAHEACYALYHPPGGTYTVLMTNENELGNYEVEVLRQNTKPEIELVLPDMDTAVTPGDTVTISWQDNDPDDNAEICLFYDSDREGYNGGLITCGLKEDDTSDAYQWTVPEGLYGPLHIYARIDDQELGPGFSYSEGRFILPEAPRPSPPQGIQVTPGDGILGVGWALNDTTEEVTAYKIYLKDQGATHHFVVEEPPFTIEPLANDETYEIAMTAFNGDGWESHVSSWHPVTLTGTSPGGPPDLTVDPEAQFTADGDGPVEMRVKVRNLGKFAAESYTLACYYDALSEEKLIASESYWNLPSQGEEEIVFSWDMAGIGVCEAKTIYCQVKDVDLPELNEANNIVVIENTMEDVAASLKLPLYTGWNLISFPLEPDNPDVQRIFGPLSDHVEVLWGYDGTWHVYDPENAGFNDLWNIHADQGYWVYVTESKPVCNLGQDADAIQLSKGWNLAGFPSRERVGVSEALGPIMEKVISVWGFDGGEWQVYDPKNLASSDLQFMEPGHGYWINVTDDGVWALP